MAEHLQRLALERRLALATVRAYSSDLSRHLDWLETCGIRSAREVNGERIREYLADLHAGGLAPRSRARARSALRGFYRALFADERIDVDPTADVEATKLPRHLPRSLSDPDVERLIEAAGGSAPLDRRDRALLELAYGAGLRVSELVTLREDQVDLADCWVRVVGKGSKERIVPIGRHARDAVARYLDGPRHALLRRAADDGRLFRNARGGPLSRMGFWRIVRARGTRAGLDASGLHPHLLRHSYATHLVERGASLRVVQELLGHAQVKTTEIYTAVDRDRVRRIHEQSHPRGGGRE